MAERKRQPSTQTQTRSAADCCPTPRSAPPFPSHTPAARAPPSPPPASPDRRSWAGSDFPAWSTRPTHSESSRSSSFPQHGHEPPEREAGAADLAYRSRLHRALDQLVAQQGEDPPLCEDRPRVSIPVHADVLHASSRGGSGREARSPSRVNRRPSFRRNTTDADPWGQMLPSRPDAPRTGSPSTPASAIPPNATRSLEPGARNRYGLRTAGP